MKRLILIALLHDLVHAYNYSKEINEMDDRINNKLPLWDNEEEKFVIQNVETPAAQQLGEIPAGEITRNDHKGIPLLAKSVNSNVPKYGVSVTAKKTPVLQPATYKFSKLVDIRS